MLGIENKTIQQKLKFYNYIAIGGLVLIALISYYFSSQIENAQKGKSLSLEIESTIYQLQTEVKAYLQYYNEKHLQLIEKISRRTPQISRKKRNLNLPENHLKQIDSLLMSLEKYMVVFNKLVANHHELSEAKKRAENALRQADKVIVDVISSIETKESDYQMEGLELSAVEHEMMNVARDSKIHFMGLQTLLYQYFISGDNSDYDRIQEFEKENKYTVVALKEFATSMENDEYVAAGKKYLKLIHSYSEAVDDLHNLMNKEKTFTKELTAIEVAGSHKTQDLSEQSSQRAIRSKTSSLLLSILLISISIFFFIVISLTISKSITSPIKSLLSAMDRIGKGDFSFDIAVNSSDEIAQIMQKLNEVIINLRAMLTLLKDNAHHLSQSSLSLTNISARMKNQVASVKEETDKVNDSSQDMKQSVQSIFYSSTQMSKNTQQVANSAKDTSENVNTVTLNIKNLSDSITDISENTNTAQQISQNASALSKGATGAIKELHEFALQIGKVTHLIKKIAHQTHLLAINTSIEASAAGVAGKGFRVIADEIRDLAAKSAHAADDISHRIIKMQTSSQKAANIFSQMVNIIQEIDDKIEHIATNVVTQNDSSKIIVHNITEASEGTRDIAAAVLDLAEQSEEVSRNTESLSTNMTQIAGSLLDVANSTALSNTEAQRVAEFAEQLSTITSSISASIDVFKV